MKCLRSRGTKTGEAKDRTRWKGDVVMSSVFKKLVLFNISRSIQIFQTDKLRRVPIHVYLCLGQECHLDL